MLDIEEITNSDAVLRKIANPDDDLIFDVGFFRLFNADTGEATDLYIVFNSANDKTKEVAIDSGDEADIETLISYSSSFRKAFINYEDYEKGTAKVFGDALHVSSELIEKYDAYLTSS